MNVWKIGYKKGAPEGINELRYCLSRSIVGVSRDDHSPVVWENVPGFRRFRDYPSQLYAIFDRIEENDLIWTRDELGVYYLGRITEYRRTRFGKGQTVPDELYARCAWFRIGTVDAVSREVADAFEPYRKFRLVPDDEVSLYSRLVYNRQTNGYRYPVTERADEDLFSRFSIEEYPDFVSLYLQVRHGYRLIPSTFLRDTRAFNFTILVGNSGTTGLVKVSVDDTRIATDEYGAFPGPIYIFAPYADLDGVVPRNMSIIAVKDLEKFMIRNLALLPAGIGNWVRHYLQTVGFGDTE